MAINFDTIPTTNGSGFALVPEGKHRAKVNKAEMRQAFDKTKPDELNLTLECFDKEGNSIGIVFDTLKEVGNTDKGTESQLYKVGRFVRACGIELTGSVDLKDIAKLVVGKEVIVDIEHNTWKEKTTARPSMFNAEIYYAVSEADEVLNKDPLVAMEDADDDDELPFVTSDEEDGEY